MTSLEVPSVARCLKRSWLRHLGPLLSLLFALSVGAALPSPAAPRDPVWKVYAIRYASVPGFPVHELVAGADTARTLDIAMMFWLLKGPDRRRVLVDAGFYRQKFLDSWKPADYRRPSEALQSFGVPADSDACSSSTATAGRSSPG